MRASLKDAHFETQAVHESGLPSDSFGSVVSPICLSTTFSKASQSTVSNQPIYEYIRTGNPTRNRLESCIAQLEGSQYCLSFSSGLAGINVIFESIEGLASGQGAVIASSDLYGGSHRYFEHLKEKLGIDVHFSSLWEEESWSRVFSVNLPVKIVWIESCTNPLLRVPNIKLLVQFIRKNHPSALIAVDNTFLSPYLMNPLALGVDIILHSATKYINGHCDVLLGAVCTNNAELFGRMKYFQNAIGNVPSPFDCYLTLRGIKTLPLRMQRHSENALRIATALSDHPAVKHVIYPGLSLHPDHEICRALLNENGRRGFGGMVSIILNGEVDTFLQSLQLILVAESLGGVESLVEVPATMTHSAMPRELRQSLGIDDKLIRMSIGIENVNDLLDDLNQALLNSISSTVVN